MDYTFNAPWALLRAEYPIGGKQCSCCKLQLPEELYAYGDKTKTYRHYQSCIACTRDCRDSESCQLGILHD